MELLYFSIRPLQLNVPVLQYTHGFLLLPLVPIDLVQHDLDLIFLHVDVLLEPLRELLKHAVLHLDLLQLGIKETLLLVKFLLELFHFVSSDLCCDLEVVLVLLLFSIVFSLLVIHFRHEFDKL